MDRLSPSTLDRLSAGILKPNYDRTAVATGIIHLGLGAFHRGHQAVYTDALLRDDPRWGILGVSLRSPDTRDALQPQRGLYSVTASDGTGDQRRVIGALTGLAVAPEDPAGLLARLADPAVRIVSTTVTEKGYSHDPATGALRADDPDIRHDSLNPGQPRSTLGFIVGGLRLRRQAGLPPYTVLACDNLPANGHTLRGLVIAFAELLDRDLARWIADTVRFPSTMVDRIVPATTDADRTEVSAALGLDDAWPVVTEPFSQWVIEDTFGGERPAWDISGAQFVHDVAPFELMKLRLLNGAHSTLAYLGHLMGCQTVAEAMAEPDLAGLVEEMMREEVTPTLPALGGFDVTAYRAALLQRFRNPALKHRTVQIAMDGTQKLPQRLLGTISDRLARGLPITRLALAVAGWMRYVSGTDEHGQPIALRDPLSSQLRALADQAGPLANRLAPALLSLASVFGRELPSNPRFAGAVETALDSLLTAGVRATVAQTRRAAR
ncbi:putative mannitol dehydrogenase family protein [Bradyrhizobium sp. ORS 375]|uniref:mannitol dehydrogenase family protein n=1 Tax=Bradyrhizobium sp. (strain ORS 375) TaxID=566679 RepID=UPI00024064DB|nr:mannitol dehydrogenase family protein [Bradyrhizobium sp. ORS 375]CCD96282.1 putative mannitol dehydrogenase family protein [Bradyrhizobium sp. ORS 375]